MNYFNIFVYICVVCVYVFVIGRHITCPEVESTGASRSSRPTLATLVCTLTSAFSSFDSSKALRKSISWSLERFSASFSDVMSFDRAAFSVRKKEKSKVIAKRNDESNITKVNKVGVIKSLEKVKKCELKLNLKNFV